jgi:hypothetical protein
LFFTSTILAVPHAPQPCAPQNTKEQNEHGSVNIKYTDTKTIEFRINLGREKKEAMDKKSPAEKKSHADKKGPEKGPAEKKDVGAKKEPSPKETGPKKK